METHAHTEIRETEAKVSRETTARYEVTRLTLTLVEVKKDE